MSRGVARVIVEMDGELSAYEASPEAVAAFAKAARRIVKRGNDMPRVLKDFRITEISAVDKPAQQGAVMTIMKSGGDETPSDYIEKASPRDAAARQLRLHAAGIRARDGVGSAESMRRARRAHPDLYEQLQKVLPDQPTRAPELATNKAVEDFRRATAEIQNRDGVPAHVAMQTVRKEWPQLYARMQQAK